MLAVLTGAWAYALALFADRPAGLLGVPLVAWLGFATQLAEQVWQRNPDRGAAAA